MINFEKKLRACKYGRPRTVVVRMDVLVSRKFTNLAHHTIRRFHGTVSRQQMTRALDFLGLDKVDFKHQLLFVDDVFEEAVIRSI